MDRDLIQLRQCMHCLQQCEWYKGRMSKRRAKELLRRCRPGSFLLRDSDNPQYRTVANSKKAFKGQISEKNLKKTEKFKKVNFYWQVTNYFYKITLFFETSPTKQHTLLQLFLIFSVWVKICTLWGQLQHEFSFKTVCSGLTMGDSDSETQVATAVVAPVVLSVYKSDYLNKNTTENDWNVQKSNLTQLPAHSPTTNKIIFFTFLHFQLRSRTILKPNFLQTLTFFADFSNFWSVSQPSIFFLNLHSLSPHRLTSKWQRRLPDESQPRQRSKLEQWP